MKNLREEMEHLLVAMQDGNMARRMVIDEILSLFRQAIDEVIGEDEELPYNVAVCNICHKPHYGRLDVEERCQCDISGEYEVKSMMCDDNPQNTLRAEQRARFNQIMPKE